MCGIIGYWAKEPSPVHSDIMKALAYQSKIRGLHAFGVSWIADDGGIKTSKWLTFPQQEWKGKVWVRRGRAIWHNRYSTSGDWRDLRNNQPIDIGTVAVASNSVITMTPPEEWKRLFGVECETANDTEIFARIIAQGESPAEFVRNITGSFAGVYLWHGEVFGVRNERRPLHWIKAGGATWVISTVDIARRALGMKESAVRAFPVGEAINLAEL